jgi:SAM-dependent methyltransferase
MNEIKHRGAFDTLEKYRGVPVHAAQGVHEAVVSLLAARLKAGAKVADLGAGHGALSLRLQDQGWDVTAFDLDCSDWLVQSVPCHQCDLNNPLDSVARYGPFDAICVLEMIDHLENPRSFLKEILRLRRPAGSVLILSMPNPLDTFSCIAMATRGIFSWAGPAQYEGGGHISILPHWLVEAHLRYLGVRQQDWRFLAPYRHPSALKQAVYRGISTARRLAARGESSFFEGQTALVIAQI